MHIAVILPSRGRTLSLKSVLTCMHSLASDENNISYTILADTDDHETYYAAEETREMIEGAPGAPTGNVLTIIQDENRLINVRENEVAVTLRADAYMPWPDDYFVCAPQWDRIIQHAIETAQIPAFSWQEYADPHNHTAIVFSRKWYEATGRIFPEYFPFWFSDTWMKEVFQFAFGAQMPIVQELLIGGKRGRTGNLRDLAFWFRVFSATRAERIEEARKISAACGIAMSDITETVGLFEKIDRIQLERVPDYEKHYATYAPPTPRYLEAKEKAERMFPELLQEAA